MLSIESCSCGRDDMDILSDGSIGFRALASLGFLHTPIPAAQNKHILKKNTKSYTRCIIQALYETLEFSRPVQQKLQHSLCAGEGSVGGQEDGGVGEVVVSKCCQ